MILEDLLAFIDNKIGRKCPVVMAVIQLVLVGCPFPLAALLYSVEVLLRL